MTHSSDSPRSRLYPVIMAGGPGKRFWPLSRLSCPKPFLKLVGSESLIQACYRHVRTLVPPERILVVVNRAHLDLVAEQLPELPPENRIGEAEGRDSAACVGFGTALVGQRDPRGIMAALPADHIISPSEAFAQALEALCEATEAESCVGTIGIPPTEAAVRFGYIEVGEAAGQYQGLEIRRVTTFREKPDPTTAARYVQSGRYLWNAGIFVSPAAVLAKAIRTHFEPLGGALEEMGRRLAAGEDPVQVTGSIYPHIPKTSIDYAVIERLDRVITLTAPFVWDDAGDWRALRRHLAADEDRNVVVGAHVGSDSRGNTIFAPGMVVATLGLEGVVVATAGKSLLVARADRLDELKDLVARVEDAADGRGPEGEDP